MKETIVSMGGEILLAAVVAVFGWVNTKLFRQKNRLARIAEIASDYFAQSELVGVKSLLSGKTKFENYFAQIVDEMREQKLGNPTQREVAWIRSYADRQAKMLKAAANTPLDERPAANMAREIVRKVVQNPRVK